MYLIVLLIHNGRNQIFVKKFIYKKENVPSPSSSPIADNIFQMMLGKFDNSHLLI